MNQDCTQNEIYKIERKAYANEKPVDRWRIVGGHKYFSIRRALQALGAFKKYDSQYPFEIQGRGGELVKYTAKYRIIHNNV